MSAEQTLARRSQRLVPKPAALASLEHRLAIAVPLSAHTLSLLKLVLVSPLVVLVLRAGELLPNSAAILTALLALFCALDYLDGVVARESGSDTWLGRILDRATDYPLLLALSYYCVDVLPGPLLLAKLGLDLVVLVLFAVGRGSTENRIRTAMSYLLVVTLVGLSQGWAPAIITPTAASMMLVVNIVFTALVALHNLGVLQKRFVADALSSANLAAGIGSIVFAAKGQPEVSCLMLMVGALMDGVDGLAARRWGGTRFGVYSDDVADAVNFGIAPGAAVFFVVGGIEGAVLGVLFAAFTISRLVFFTLSVGKNDPNYFAGVPSPVGGCLVLCAAVLFRQHPALVGLLVGVACVLMSSFDTRYRHLGRLLAVKKRRMIAVALGGIGLALLGIAAGPRLPIAIALAASLFYALLPLPRHFARVASS